MKDGWLHKKLEVEIHCETEDDLAIILEEITMQIAEDFNEGFLNTDVQRFNWSLTDIPSEGSDERP